MRGRLKSCKSTLYLNHVIDAAYANLIFWDEMQFWILQFCQTRFRSVTILGSLWVIISESPFMTYHYDSYYLALIVLGWNCIFIFNLQVYLQFGYFRKWIFFIFQKVDQKRCAISFSFFDSRGQKYTGKVVFVLTLSKWPEKMVEIERLRPRSLGQSHHEHHFIQICSKMMWSCVMTCT